MADFHKVKIADVYKETKDTVVVEFDIPDSTFLLSMLKSN